MQRKNNIILFIMLILPTFVLAADKDIEATKKFADIITGLTQIAGGCVCLYAILQNGIKETIKSLGSSDRTAEENKSLMTKAAYLTIGLVMIFFVTSIRDYIMSFL